MSVSPSLPSTALAHWLRTQHSSFFAELIEHFLLQFQSQHTRRNYAADIESFLRWWAEKNVNLCTNPHTITDKHILLWLEQFKESSTRARKLASLSSFFKFCEKRRFVERNPCQLIRRPRVEPTLSTQALNEEETLQLLSYLHSSAFEHRPDGSHTKRQQRSAHLRFAVLHTLFSVGMRVDELCELRMSDLLFHPPVFKLRFVSKGGDEHTTVISDNCAQVINTYVQACRGRLGPEDYVFIRAQSSERPVKLSQTAVYNMIREAALDAGLNKKLSPHSARATVATVLHRQGVPLGFIQSLLNHKQITTTAHYVKKANERSESAALKAPVSAWIAGEDE